MSAAGLRAGATGAAVPAERPKAGTRPPNVVLIALDCVRAGSTPGSFGEKVARTPRLESMVRHGTLFRGAVAPSNWTVPSHMSFFTGAYPSTHGRRTFERGSAPAETIATWLSNRKYETALFSEMVHLVGGYGLEDGFEHRVARRAGISDEERTVVNRLAGHADFLYSARVRRLIERLPPLIVPMNAFNHPQEVAYKQDVCGDYLLGDFDSWLTQRDADRPFFTFFNFVDAHEPYPEVQEGPPVGTLGRWYARTPRYYLLSVRGLQAQVPWEHLVDGYLQTIEEADRKVGKVLEALERHNEYDRSLIIVTADHGQSFGEAGNVYHGCGATESITRVPLWVSPPAEYSVPGRIDRWMSLCEIPAWIKAVATGRAPYDEEGRAPFPYRSGVPDDSIVYCEGAPASDPNRSLEGIGLDQLWNHRLLAAYREREKYVLDQATGVVYHWSVTGSLDRRDPEVLTGPDAQELRTQVFAPYEQADLDRMVRSPKEAVGKSAGEVDKRLRSWGYG